MEEVIKRFLSVSYGSSDGSGLGDGDGSGEGSGYGSGIGSGYGNTYGDGYCDGYCDGSGEGSSNGLGDGSGYGSGDGSGYGYDDGYCDGGYSIKKYGEHSVYLVDSTQTLIYSVHGNYAKGAIINSDLTLSPCFIAKEFDYFAHGETLQEAIKAVHAKTIQNLPEEERIDKFLQEYPDKNKKQSGRVFFNWHHILTGSCYMGRKQFCKDNNIDIDAKYTPMEFLDICKDAYGSNVIKQIIKRYN